ncbi:hypothetical protein IW262DRAFT_1506349 [Armillaria fumosa]|nr:hypothetical protein IW262DRAFT_1506349 [Armillaria fumosa]
MEAQSQRTQNTPRRDGDSTFTVVAFAIPRRIHVPEPLSTAAAYGTNVFLTLSGDLLETNRNDTKNERVKNTFRVWELLGDQLVRSKKCHPSLVTLLMHGELALRCPSWPYDLQMSITSARKEPPLTIISQRDKQARWTLSGTVISHSAGSLSWSDFHSGLMSEPSHLSFPQEICDTIIDLLRYDRRSLLPVSLTCRAFYPRTRVYLFSHATLSTESSCIRLARLISLSPKLALLFKSLKINAASHDSIDYRPFSVIKSLVNLKHLTLSGGDWSRIPDTVVTSLQSHSYRTFRICPSFKFRSIGEICLLLQSSPHLRWVSFWFKRTFMEECHLDHSLHRTPAPATLHIGEADPTFPIETLLKLAATSRPYPFSFRNVRTLNIILSSRNAMLRQHLNQYLCSQTFQNECPRAHATHNPHVHIFRDA